MSFPLADQIPLIALLQSMGWLEVPMRFFTFLGSETFFLLVLPVVYWCIDAGLGMRIGFILLFSNIFNGIVKLALLAPRPYWIDAGIKALAAESTFGAPSGHAQMATGIWGMAAARFRRRSAWIIAVTLVFLIGLSRIYLAVHFPSDVLLGWLLGGLTLWAFLALWQPVAAWAKRRTVFQQVLLGLLAPALLLLCNALLVFTLRGYVLPAEWVTNAARAGEPLPAPLSMGGVLTASGTMLGLALGLIWIYHRGGFQPSGPVLKRAVCFLVGLMGVAALYFGLKVLAPSEASLLGLSWHFMRYALLGVWIAAGAPLAFIRLGLTEGRLRPPDTAISTA